MKLEFYEVSTCNIKDMPAINRLYYAVLDALWEAYKEHDYSCIKVLKFDGPLPRGYRDYVYCGIHTKFQDCYTYTHYIRICSLRQLLDMLLNNIGIIQNSLTIKGMRMGYVCS